MQVQIQIVAMDHENGVKKTMSATIDVPKAVLALHEMVSGGDPSERVTVVATSVFLGAKRELDASRRNRGTALLERANSGAPVGGARGGKTDPLGDALGLDLIDAMAAKERGGGAQHAPARTPMAHGPQDGPGPIGFPARR